MNIDLTIETQKNIPKSQNCAVNILFGKFMCYNRVNSNRKLSKIGQIEIILYITRVTGVYGVGK